MYPNDYPMASAFNAETMIKIAPVITGEVSEVLDSSWPSIFPGRGGVR